jgi:3-hydroxybutyryl-CoA dehydratase
MKIIHFTITEQEVEQYAVMSGDFNPIHLDLNEANKQGFSNKIAHGMLTMSKTWSVLAKEILTPHDIFYQFSVSFLSPVYIGSQITLTISQLGNEYQIEGKSDGKTIIKGILELNEKL